MMLTEVLPLFSRGQQGLVAVWSIQRRSRFSREGLRLVCLCAEFREHSAVQSPVSQHLYASKGITKDGLWQATDHGGLVHSATPDYPSSHRA